MEKDTLTFYQHGMRRIECPYCGHYMATASGILFVTKLTHKTEREYQCPHCKKVVTVMPPRRFTNERGEKMIEHGALPNTTFTNDQTRPNRILTHNFKGIQ